MNDIKTPEHDFQGAMIMNLWIIRYFSYIWSSSTIRCFHIL